MSVADLHRGADWAGLHIGVAGIGIAGFAAADALLSLGARVSAFDAGEGLRQVERGQVLEVLGATVRLGDGDTLPEGLDLLVVSPGLSPLAPVIAAAGAAGMPVWGELELAWRLRPEGAAPWLVVTGTNGKTTTTLMLESILRAAGLRTVAAGNIGVSMVEVVMGESTSGGTLDVIAVEVGAPQLPFLHTMSPQAAVCLNIAEDHVDLFGSFEAYVAAKARIYERTQVAAVYNVADEVTRRMVQDAEVIEGCRAIGFTLGTPDLSMLGLVEDLLVDRAFVPNRAQAAQELATVADVRPAAAHNVANALAAAALA
ncbi:MAG: Mur ligase family protein, partial [Candidatus Nanopelagicales bacterium]